MSDNPIDHLYRQVLQNQARQIVITDTLCHIMREITQKMGIPPVKFDEHYQSLRDFYHAQYLDHLSKTSQSMAGLLDDRPMENVHTGEPIPPLFD